MIGLAATPDEMDVAREFFELFKTPWEPAVPGRVYPVVLAAGAPIEGLRAHLFVIYGSGEHPADRKAGCRSTRHGGRLDVRWGASTFPVYRGAARFEAPGEAPTITVAAAAPPASLAYQRRLGDAMVHRIGYDLFAEIRYLLGQGQPAAQALTPTLELHIALLRHVLSGSGIAFLEIPPAPPGHDFICCLTHDIDFYGIRRHAFDRTMAGFLLRASLGTLLDLARGRRSMAEALTNWRAVCALPFVFLGLLADPWRPFEHYAGADPDPRSTFFLIPFKHRPGQAPDGAVHRWRAAPYEIRDIEPDLARITGRGVELAIHGIDAWRNADAGREERRQLTPVTGQTIVGVRMHWLYYAADSPGRLEAAGFDYDSTCGYNDAVGYRAGTLQAFRPPGAATLMELPLVIMDSALFSSARMALDRTAAARLYGQIVAQARRFGGALVVNWHDRSLAAERLWGASYGDLLREIARRDRAWFTTAGGAVRWFRWRRSITFHRDERSLDRLRVAAPPGRDPGGVIRLHRPGPPPAIVDLPLAGGHAIEVDVGNGPGDGGVWSPPSRLTASR
jgi:hypothetical protein